MGLFGGGGGGLTLDTTTEYLSVYAYAVQGLGSGDNDITFDEITVDPTNSYDSGTGVFTITKGGVYIVKTSCVYDGGTSGDIYDIKLVGSILGVSSINGSGTYADANGTARFAGVGIANLLENETVKIVIYYAGGNNPSQNNGDAAFNTFQLFRLS